MRTAAAWVLLLGLAPAGAQEFAELFQQAEHERAHAEAEPKRVQAAYARAWLKWLALPEAEAMVPATLRLGAIAAARAGEARRAPELLEAAWAAGNHDAEVAGLRFAVLLANGQSEAAVRFAIQCEKDQPGTLAAAIAPAGTVGAPQLLQAADRWLRSREVELGLWTFRAMARACGDHPLALANLALALRHLGRESECDAVYRQALAKAPEDALLWNDYALFLKGTGQLEAATRAFTKGLALENPPGSSPALPNLVLLARSSGQPFAGDVHTAMATVLSLRPDAAFPRRLALDLLLGRR